MDELLRDDNGKLTLVETYCNTQHTCILYKHKKLQIIRTPEKETIISRLVKSEKELWLWTRKEKKESERVLIKAHTFPVQVLPANPLTKAPSN